MSEEGEIDFVFGVVLCPKCEAGRITKGHTRVYGYSTGHLEAAIHMVCPNCGETLLVQGDGKRIGYNFDTNSHTCDSKAIVILSDDSEEETDEPKERS